MHVRFSENSSTCINGHALKAAILNALNSLLLV